MRVPLHLAHAAAAADFTLACLLNRSMQQYMLPQKQNINAQPQFRSFVLPPPPPSSDVAKSSMLQCHAPCDSATDVPSLLRQHLCKPSLYPLGLPVFAHALVPVNPTSVAGSLPPLTHAQAHYMHSVSESLRAMTARGHLHGLQHIDDAALHTGSDTVVAAVGMGHC